MDIQSLIAALGNGGGPRPMMLNPGGAMGALPGSVTPPAPIAPTPGLMPQMPHPMQPGPQAPNPSAQMANQALSAPPPPQQDPMAGLSGMLNMAAMAHAGGGDPNAPGAGGLGDLLGLNKPAAVPLTIPSQGGFGAVKTSIDPSMPDLGGQAPGIHGLFHRLAGLFGG